MNMLSDYPFSAEWKSDRTTSDLGGLIRRLTLFHDMNQYRQYMANWPIALEALRQLWEVGKVSELKSPFYERVERRTNR